jgi:hypothetical protein
MTTKVNDRQYPLAAVLVLGPANVGAGNGKSASIPAGATVLRVSSFTSIAFNGTTPTGTVSDGTTTFANAVDVSSAGNETVANAPKHYPTGGTITASLANAGGSTTVGEEIVVIEYVRKDRGNEIQE